MKDQGKIVAIAVLCITAALLLCTLLIVDRLPLGQAVAGNSPERQGDYIMIPGGNPKSTEAVIIIDVAARKLVAYALPGKKIEVAAIYDLSSLP